MALYFLAYWFYNRRFVDTTLFFWLKENRGELAWGQFEHFLGLFVKPIGEGNYLSLNFLGLLENVKRATNHFLCLLVWHCWFRLSFTEDWFRIALTQVLPYFLSIEKNVLCRENDDWFRLSFTYLFSISVSHDSFICVTWLIHMCDITHPYVWHDSFICVTWLIHMRDMTHSYVWHDSFICVTWHILRCDMTHLHVRHDSFIYVIWHIHICDMTDSNMWHGTIIWV